MGWSPESAAQAYTEAVELVSEHKENCNAEQDERLKEA